jgi:hypothetical protein
MQPRRLQPHVLVVRTRLAAAPDVLARLRQLAGLLLQARSRDPAGAVQGVGLDDRFEQQLGLLQIADVGVAEHGNAAEAVQVARRVHVGGACHGVARLANAHVSKGCQERATETETEREGARSKEHTRSSLAPIMVVRASLICFTSVIGVLPAAESRPAPP